MRINWDLTREILFAIEALDHVTDIKLNKGKQASNEENNKFYHANYLHESGLIECDRTDPDFQGNEYMRIYDLTAKGHDFLEQIRKNTVWNKIKELAKQKGFALSFKAISDLASQALSTIIS